MLNVWHTYGFAGFDTYIYFFCEIYNKKGKEKRAFP